MKHTPIILPPLLLLLLFAPVHAKYSANDSAIIPRFITQTVNTVTTSTRINHLNSEPSAPYPLTLSIYTEPVPHPVTYISAIKPPPTDILPYTPTAVTKLDTTNIPLPPPVDPNTLLHAILPLPSVTTAALNLTLTLMPLPPTPHTAITPVLPALPPASTTAAAIAPVTLPAIPSSLLTLFKPNTLTLPPLGSRLTTGQLHSSTPPPAASQPRTVAHPKMPPGSFAQLTASLMIRDGLIDGTLNPRSPLWRPQLAYLLAHPKTNPADSEQLFTLILASCPGADAPTRQAAAENWAREHETGRYAPHISFAAARHSFHIGDHTAAIARCNSLLATNYHAPDQLLALRALAETYSGQPGQAISTIRELRQNHPDSATLPETLFMEAWIALQQNDPATATRLFRRIITSYPRSSVASRAAAALDSIQPLSPGGHL